MSSIYLFGLPRLGFRETTVNDAETMYRLNSDPEVMQYTGVIRWYSVDEAREFLARLYLLMLPAYVCLKKWACRFYGRM